MKEPDGVQLCVCTKCLYKCRQRRWLSTHTKIEDGTTNKHVVQNLMVCNTPHASSHLCFPVCARIAIVRQHRCDGARTRAPARVNHHQQLHKVVIDGRAGGLDQEHITAADGLADL